MNAFIAKLRQYPQYYLLLSLFSASLLSLSWYFPFTPLAFLGLAPLLEIESQIAERKPKYPTLQFFLYGWLTLCLWNVGVIWWLWNAAGWATLGAWIANSLLQVLPLVFFQIIKRTSANRFGYFAFVVCWITFEWVHLQWDFSWVWLNLGNVFANTPSWVQWYSITGSFGGTLWVLLANVVAFKWIFQYKLTIYAWVLLVLLPIIPSVITYWNYEATGEEIEVVAVQPNLDCYTEKFSYNAKTGEQKQATHVPYQKQIKRLLDLSSQSITPATKYVLFPETALHNGVNITEASNYFDVKTVSEWVQENAHVSVLSGIDAFKKYGKEAGHSPTERYAKGFGYYDVYGSSIFIQEGKRPEFYHKSKLVIGVETIPLGGILKPLIMNFGGSSGGLGRQAERGIFQSGNAKLAPVICYESVYGDFMTGYVKNGANFIAIITNDGWWGNTPGHRQHLNYARLRAIELRRDIARSANTGVSAFINQRGDIVQETKYNEMIALKGKVQLNNEMTFYARYGDYLGRLSAFIAAFMLIASLVKRKVTS